jgi:hypothetical protein
MNTSESAPSRWQLVLAEDFVSNFQRCQSILWGLQAGLKGHLEGAEEKGGEFESLAIEAEAFSENIGWLFERLEFKASGILKALQEAGTEQ